MSAILLLLASLAFAGKGETGAAFLKISPGARPAAMADAFGGLADDVHAAYYNPAGLGRLERVQVTGAHEERFEGLTYDYAAMSVPLLAWVDSPRPRTDFGVLALSVYSLQVDGIERRSTTETDQPLDTFKAADTAYALSYGLSLPESPWSFGGTLKLVESRIDTARASAAAFDLGALYRDERWSAGGGARHLGQAQRFREQADPLPRQLYAGGAYRLNESWLAAVELRQPASGALGLERSKRFGRSMQGFFRCGYDSARRDSGFPAGLTAGLGLQYNAWNLDFAWIPGGELGDSFKYSLVVKF